MKDVNVNHPEPQLQAADARAALLSLPVLPEQVLEAKGPGVSGQDYWRSLEEYVDTQTFHELLGQEFPGYDPDEIRTLSRRRFIQLAAASLALAGITLTGCRRWPQEKLAPFTVRPEGRIPGKPEQFASVITRNGLSTGVLATSHDGRPIKLGGNPLHPTSLGATDLFTQAEILELYNPHRLPFPRQKQGDGSFRRSSWEAFAAFATTMRQELDANAGQGLVVISQAQQGPSFQALRAQLTERYPRMQWVTWEPVDRRHTRQGTQAAFGQSLRPHYQIDQAWCIAAFDSDFLVQEPASLVYARQWAANRKQCDRGRMNRMYAVESRFSTTGSVADHRLPVTSAKVATVLLALAQRLGVAGVPAMDVQLNGQMRFVDAMAEDLKVNAGKSLVLVGEHQPPAVHVLGWMINSHLGNLNKTVRFTAEPQDSGRTLEALADAVGRMQEGEVSHLLMLGGNPLYDAPADLDFAQAIEKVQHRIHLSMLHDETTQACTWSLPQAHFLEAWGDGRAYDGTLSVQQPLIMPLFDTHSSPGNTTGGRSDLEVLDLLLRQRPRSGWDMVRQIWQEENLLTAEPTFEATWRTALHDGLVKDSAAAVVTAALAPAAASAASLPATSADSATFEINFHADASVYDGRYANNGWLQEIPGEMTKLTWDNVALMHVEDARALGVETGSMIQISVPFRQGEARSVRIAVMVQPGQARGAISLALGYGRTMGGPIAQGVGFDTYQIRTVDGLNTTRATLSRSPGRHRLAFTQNHHLLDGVAAVSTTATRSAAWALEKRLGKVGKSGYIIKEASLEEYGRNPSFVKDKDHGDVRLQLFNSPHQRPATRPGGPTAFNRPHAWGMTLDMTACIGCNACVASCQAENNIPIVGKEQVLFSREMHWLRIDRYFKGDPAGSPEVVHQPVTCLHCENAPCEQVCPVAATVHDTEGLNTMVYNRCIGTRYCSNNCPYKVRRFNFLDYHSLKSPGVWAKPWLDWPDQQQLKSIGPLERMKFNPEVTVRMRGVMEKCTFCTQRIQYAKSEARIRASRTAGDEGLVQEGDFQTACQEVCPTQAITFGDLNDGDSHVSRSQALPRSYDLLAELNTRPRATHLALIRNKNPKLIEKNADA